MKIPTSVKDFEVHNQNNLSFDTEIQGIDFEKDVTLDDIINSYKTTGLQAANLSKAIEICKKMVKKNVKIFFGATSNITTSGLREVIKYLAKKQIFEVYVTTGGGIEEDIIKCFNSTKLGEFTLDGVNLRDNNWNRAGNMLIHGEGYVLYEKWIRKLLDRLTEGHSVDNPKIMTPSQFIREMGKEINDERSILYWCYKNSIPVYSPAILDGSTGDIMTFYPEMDTCKLKLDLVEDVKYLNMECLSTRENGAVIVGSGLVKHQILNANLFNNGLEYCVLLNTAIDYDGSDSGAPIQEAYSWGKVKPEAESVKISGEASIIFPLLVYGGFVSKNDENK